MALISLILVDRLINGVTIDGAPIHCERVNRYDEPRRLAELSLKYPSSGYRITIWRLWGGREKAPKVE